MKAWMVRAGSNGERVEPALEQGRVYAGWPELNEDLSGCISREDIEVAVRGVYSDESTHTIGNWTGQLDRFVRQMSLADLVVMPRQSDHGFALGRISSPYMYDETAEPGLQHYRTVFWKQELASIDHFQGDLRATLGTILSVYQITRNEAPRRLLEMEQGGVDPGPQESQGEQFSSFDDLASRAPVITTARTLVHLVGQYRRSTGAVALIETELARRGLTPRTPLTEGLIDDDVEITSTNVTTATSQSISTPDSDPPPSFTLGVLPTARRAPVSVELGDSIAKARTLMVRDRLSQLPVLNQGAPIGLITWQSLACAGPEPVRVVADALAPLPVQYPLDWPLSQAVDAVQHNGFILVTDGESLCGLVTASEIASYFGEDRIPLMAIEQIELSLRRVVGARLTDGEVARSSADARNVAGLTMGGYCHLLHDPEVWIRLPWTNMDQEIFLEELEFARMIRNQLSHFSPDPLPADSLPRLHGFLRLLSMENPL